MTYRVWGFQLELQNLFFLNDVFDDDDDDDNDDADDDNDDGDQHHKY